MLSKFYLALSVMCMTWYAAASLAGWEYGNPRRYRVPLAALAASHGPVGPGYVGRSPGGSSSSTPGSSGFGGGK